MDKIKISTVVIEPLSLISNIVKLQFDNSSTIIDEMEGEEYFYLLLDTKSNSAIGFSNNVGESVSKQFLNVENAGFYNTYVEWKSFEGCFSISSYDSNTNSQISFHGSEIIDSENVSEADIKLISSILTPKNVFAIVNEIISAIK